MAKPSEKPFILEVLSKDGIWCYIPFLEEWTEEEKEQAKRESQKLTAKEIMLAAEKS